MVFYALATLILPFAGIVGLAVVLAMLALAGWYFGDAWSYHLISMRHADFLAGVIVFLLGGSERFGLLVAAIGAGVLILTRSHDFAFAIPFSMGCILFGMIELKLPWSRWPLSWLILVGDASYSVYLLHVLVFTGASYVAVHFVPVSEGLCEVWRFGAIGLTCVISLWAWRLIEVPGIKYGNQFARRFELSRASWRESFEFRNLRCGRAQTRFEPCKDAVSRSLRSVAPRPRRHAEGDEPRQRACVLRSERDALGEAEAEARSIDARGRRADRPRPLLKKEPAIGDGSKSRETPLS